MARGRNGPQFERTQADRQVVAQHFVHARRGERIVHAVLRVVTGCLPAGHHRRGLGRSDQLRTAAPLQVRQTPDMVEVHVALEQHLYILDAEPERSDVGRDQPGARCGAPVDQDVSRIAGDQDCRDTAGADVPAVAVNAERRAGFVPVVPVGTGIHPLFASAALVIGSRELRRHSQQGDEACQQL